MNLVEQAVAGFATVDATAEQRSAAAEHLGRWLTDAACAPIGRSSNG